MPTPVNPPDLIITLSRDKVRLQLLEQPETGRTPWQSTFPIEGSFLEEELSRALDAALLENESLMDQFGGVEDVILDRPNIFIPPFYAHNGKLAEIAGRYLRLRAGDSLTSNTTEDMVFVFSIPTVTVHVLQEYYANVGHLHMASVIWTALKNHEVDSAVTSRVYFTQMENTLIVLGETAGKLTFSKNFYIKSKEDLLYYVIACNRLLRSKENWHVSIRNEIPLFEIPGLSQFQIHHHIELPELHTLVAQQRLCEL